MAQPQFDLNKPPTNLPLLVYQDQIYFLPGFSSEKCDQTLPNHMEVPMPMFQPSWQLVNLSSPPQ